MKILKYVFVVITALMILYAIQPTAHAATQVKNFDQMSTAIKNWSKKGESGQTGIDAGGMRQIVAPIINILTGIGVVVLVAVTIIMGMKYMFATPDQAAKLKQQLIGLVVSAVVILGATAIWKIVYTVLTKTSL